MKKFRGLIRGQMTRRRNRKRRQMIAQQLEDRCLLASLIQALPIGGSAGYDVATDGVTHLVGAPHTQLGGLNQVGKAYLYDAVSGAREHELQHPSPGAIDDFGFAVSVDGTQSVVGAWSDTVNNNFAVGSAHVYDTASGSLVASLANPDTSGNDWFGYDVAIDNGIAAVSAPRDNKQGVVYVFNASTGALLHTIHHPEPTSHLNTHFFGRSIALDNGALVVTAQFTSDSQSKAYVFDVASGNLVRSISDPGSSQFDGFSYAIDLDGNHLVVGAQYENVGLSEVGVAYLFDISNGSLIRTINNPTPAEQDRFGSSVSISGNQIVVGAALDDGAVVNSGAAYLFDLQGNLIDTLDNPSPDSGDNFGLAVSIGGDYVLVGSKDDAIGGGQKGSAYVFTSGPPPFDVTLSSNTVQENLLPASIIGNLSTDSPENGPYTFELVSGSAGADNALFTIVGSELRTTSSFDFEARNSLNILVRATSAGGLISQKPLTITVVDVNETPADLIIDNTAIAEMNRVGDVIGSFLTNDPDANDSFTYSLISGDGGQDNAAFSISGNQLVAAERFDYESKRSFSVRVRSTDSGGLSVEKAFGIHVTDVNPPALESLPTYDLRPVIDLNNTATSSNPSEAIELGGTIFFTATTPETGTELWRTDGTQNGTALVSDLVEGVDSSNPARLAPLNGKVIYFADYSDVDPDAPPGGIAEKRLGLFTSHPDTGVTERIYSFDGWPSGLPATETSLFHFTRVGNELFFLSTDQSGTDKILWKTDGTIGGTNPIKTLVSSGGAPEFPGGPGGTTDPIPTAVLGNLLLFNLDVSTADGTHTLWRSDGTETGTYILRSGEAGFGSGFQSLDPNIEVIGTNAYFVSNSTSEGKELWVTDGANANLVKDIFAGPDDSGPRSLTSHNGKLYFIADDGSTGSELWVSDGTQLGTRLVKDIAPGFGSGLESPLISWNGHLYFAANDDLHGYELWRSDGTEIGTQMLVDAETGFGSLLPQNFVPLDDRLLFSPSTFSGFAGQLWSTDGTAAGTSAVANVSPFQTVVSNGLAYFFADGGDGKELWTSDGTSVGTTQVVDLNPGTADGINTILGTGVGKVLLRGQNESSGVELVLSDGTTVGTTIIDPTLGTPPANIHDVLKVGDRFYISAGRDLVVTDGTDAGTTVLKTFSSTFNAPRELTWFKDRLFFTAEGSSSEGRELWRSDGTAAGTVLHKDIWAGSNDGNPERLTVAGQNLFFVANDGVHGEELWEVDLGDAGARLHADFVTGAGDGDITLLQAHGDSLFVIANETLFVIGSSTAASGPATALAATKSNSIMPWGDVIYFGGYDAQHGNELWRTDGTASGTYLVADLLKGASSSNPGGGVVFEGSVADGGSATTNAKLVFRATVGANNHQLWSTDGTTAGTKQLTDFEPSVGSGQTASFTPVGMTVLGNSVYFEAFDAAHGRELWRSNGTVAGTELVADMRPGTFPNPLTLTEQGESWWDKRIDAPTVFNGQLFFRTFDPASGHELWVSDGTTAGSRLAVDAIPDAGSSYPNQMFTSDGRLYLTADTLTYGTGTLPGSGELFYVNESPLIWSAEYVTLRNQSITVPLNAIDRDGDDLVYQIVNGPSEGSVQIVGDSLVFTPASNDVSQQVVSIRAFDGTLYSTPATYRFNVRDSAAEYFFAESETTLTEQEGIHHVEVRLSAPASTIVNVPYRVEGGTVLAASIANTGSVTFHPGQTSATIPVLLADDAVYQPPGSTIEVTLFGSTDAIAGSRIQHTLSVTDNDSMPILSLPEPFQKVDEADTTLGIVVSLSHPGAEAITTTISISGLSATLGTDYSATGLTELTFAPGEVRKTIPVRLFDDSSVESREIIFANISAVSGAITSSDPTKFRHLIYIEDNDTSVVELVEKGRFVAEGQTATFTARRTGGNLTNSLTVPFEIRQQEATSGADFTPPETLSFHFAPGEAESTVHVQINDDDISESTESFSVQLLTGSFLIGNADQSFVFISDTDQIRPSLSLSSTSITEWAGIGQEQTIDVIVRLNVPSENVQSVPISVSRATFAPFATYQNDFSLDLSDFVFQPGQTELRRTLTIHDDAVTEGDESVRIVLANSDTANLLSLSDDRVKELKILDDDFSVDVIAPSNVSEDAGTVTFTLRRPVGADNSGLVYLSFIGTATRSGSRRDVDLPTSQTVFFLNESEKTVTVNLVDDTKVEGPETLGLIVERLVGNELLELDRATVTITDDDTLPTVGISQPVSGLLLDGTGSASIPVTSTSIPVTLSRPSDTTTFVNVEFAGDGLLNEDFLVAGNVIPGANPGTLSVFIPAGATESSISIQPIPRNFTTPDRQVEVVVVGSLNGLVPYNPPRTTITIPGVERATVLRGSEADNEKIENANNGQLQIDEAAATGSTGGDGARLNAPSSNSDVSDIVPLSLAIGVQNTGLIDGGTIFFDADFDGRIGFVDVNEDGRQGANEPSETVSQTFEDGSFGLEISSQFDRDNSGIIEPSEGRIVAVGGTDNSIGLETGLVMTAPVGLYNVSATSTLIESLVRRHQMSVSEATLRVSEALGAGDYNFTIARPVYEIIAGDVAAKLVYVNQVQISSLAIAAGRMAEGIEGDGFQDHVLRAFDALADQISSAGDVAAWANPNTIGYMLRDVNSYATAPLTNEAIQQLADLLAARMSDLSNLLETPFASEIAFLETLTRMKKVLHGELADAIRDFSAESRTFSEIETLYGDAAFLTLAESQSIGVIVPPAIGVGNAIVSEGHGDTTVLRFEVGVVGNHAGSISVDYQSFDGTARSASGDYVPVSGTLTWSAGDTESQFIEIPVNGDLDFESDETVLLLLSNPTDAVIRIDTGFGFIVNDDYTSVNASTSQPVNQYVVVHSADRLSTVHQQQLQIDGNFFASTRLDIAGDQDVPNDFVVDFGSSTFRADNYSFSGGTNNDQLTMIGGTFRQIMVGGVSGSQPQIRLIGQDGTPVEMTMSGIDLIRSDVSQLDRVQLRLDSSTSMATLSDPDSQETGQMTLVANGAGLPEWVFANPSLVEIVSFNPAFSVDQLSQDPEFVGSVTIRQAGALLSSESISSTAVVDSVLGEFTSEDPLFSDSFSLSLLSGPTENGNSVFRIEGASLVLNAPLDSLAGSNASIVVSMSNEFGDTLEQTFTLSIESPSDTTAPTARIVPLPLSWASSTIDLDVVLDDSGGDAGEPISGVASYDLYVAVDDGSWTLFADDVPASQTQISVPAESNKRYWFRAVATDVAGNVELDAGISEANTFTLDFDPPETTVADVQVDESSGLMTLNLTGIDLGGSQVTGFDVYVSIDGAAAVRIPGTPVLATDNGDGTFSAQISYQGLRDGASHTYRFFSQGRDSRGNIEAVPMNTYDFELTRVFTAVAALAARDIIIQNGETQRSYIRNIDILFNDAAGLQDLISGNRIQLERFAADTTNTTAGSGTVMGGLNATTNGSAISIDFGADGLGGARNAGDGYYRLSIDLDGDGEFDDAFFEFFRLFGDSDGDGIVSNNDYRAIYEDINGDGRIDSRDRRDARLFRGNQISAVRD